MTLEELMLITAALDKVSHERDQLRAERERLRAALETLALALTDHHHQWTNAERSLYEKAVSSARSSAGTAPKTA
jgi:hypothetical protein